MQSEITVPGYSIHERIGQGGFGEVFRATDLATSVVRAVKVLIPLPFADGACPDRFKREAEAVSRLGHKAIVPCHAHGFTKDENGYPFLVFDLVEGESFDVKAASMGFADRVSVVVDVLDALAHAHGKGVLHRDVKPSNIMIRASDEQALLLDFGAAYVWEGVSSQTVTTQFVGSLGFVPPEVQANPKHRAHSHDVFSAATTLYKALRGEMPNRDGYKPVSEVNEALSGLDPIIRKGLAPEAERFQETTEMAEALRAWVARHELRRTLKPSPLAGKVRAELLRQAEEAEDRRKTDDLRRLALDAAWRACHDVVIVAAETAFEELVDQLLTVDHSFELHRKDENEAVKPDVPSDLLEIRNEGGQAWLRFALGKNFNAPLGRRNEPLLVWPPQRSGVAPPGRFANPVWLIYLKSRSSSTLFGGLAAALGGPLLDPKLSLYGRSPDHKFRPPIGLATPDDVRDYVLRAAARAYGVQV